MLLLKNTDAAYRLQRNEKNYYDRKDTYRNKEEASDSLKEDYNYEATNDDPAVLRSEIAKLKSELEQLRFEEDIMKEISKQLKKKQALIQEH